MHIETVPMDITPDLALEWLTRNTHNRPLRPAIIKAFKADILGGRILDTHEAIAFTEKDIDKRILVDGQNRLHAIMELGEEGHTDISVRLLVAFGVPLEAQRVINTGAKRGAVDQLWIENIKATTMHISIARAMSKSSRMSVAEVVEFTRKHWKAIAYMGREFHSGLHIRGVNIAPVAAACARAFIVASPAERDAIRNFIRYLIAPEPERSGFADRRGIASGLRSWLREQARAETRQKAAGRGEMYWRTIEALRQWLGRPVADNLQPFVLPGEIW